MIFGFTNKVNKLNLSLMISVNLLSAIIVIFFIITSILLLLDYNKNKKENIYLTVKSYLGSEIGKSYIQSIGIIASILLGISAIIISTISSGLIYEQMNIAKNNYMMQINPIVNIEEVIDYNTQETIGFKIRNEGLNDITNLNIFQKFHWFIYRDNNWEPFGVYNFSKPFFHKDNLIVNDSTLILFDTSQINTFKSLIIKPKPSIGVNKDSTVNNIIPNNNLSRTKTKGDEGILIMDIKYNRLPDLKEYSARKIYRVIWLTVHKDKNNYGTFFIFQPLKNRKSDFLDSLSSNFNDLKY